MKSPKIGVTLISGLAACWFLYFFVFHDYREPANSYVSSSKFFVNRQNYTGGTLPDSVLFVWTDDYLYESSFIFHELIKYIPKSCEKVRLELRQRPFKDDGHSKSLIFAVSGIKDEERSELASARRRVGFIHLSDEMFLHDTSFYDQPAFVFRHYDNERSSYEYLKQDQESCDQITDSGSSVFWLPLGYGPFFYPLDHFMKPHANRTYLFAWFGSTAGKPERDEMIQAVQEQIPADMLNTRIIMKDLHKFNNQEAMLKDFPYSRLMYDSKFMPCPAGGSPEQFRIYESISAGAIPIVKRGHRVLQYLDDLELEVAFVDDWSELPRLLLGLENLDAELAESWKTNVHNRWLVITSRMRKFFSCMACQLAYR